jgi:hypothetical protein
MRIFKGSYMAKIDVESSFELEEIARYGTLKRINTDGYETGSQVSEAARYVTRVGEIVAQFRGAIQQVKDSTHYTPEGRASRFAAAGVETLPRLDIFEPFLKKCRETLAELRRSTVMTGPSAGDNAAKAIREAEVRQSLPRDPIEVKLIYWEAIDEGDEAVYLAIRNAPAFMKLLPPDDVKEGEAMWVNKRNPEKSKQIRDLDNAISVLQETIDRARRIVQTECGMKLPDPIEEIARGGQ